MQQATVISLFLEQLCITLGKTKHVSGNKFVLLTRIATIWTVGVFPLLENRATILHGAGDRESTLVLKFQILTSLLNRAEI